MEISIKGLALSLLILMGCATTEQYIGIVHDYVFTNATKLCKNEGSELHYIVSDLKLKIDKNKSYPCQEDFIVRCQNGKDYTMKSEIAYCFIPRSQLLESLDAKSN